MYAKDVTSCPQHLVIELELRPCSQFLNTSKCFTPKLQAAQFADNAVSNSNFTVKKEINLMKFGNPILRPTEIDNFFTHITK
jgi:hypothetical protein